jgi:hypothetical protein
MLQSGLDPQYAYTMLPVTITGNSTNAWTANVPYLGDGESYIFLMRYNLSQGSATQTSVYRTTQCGR